MLGIIKKMFGMNSSDKADKVNEPKVAEIPMATTVVELPKKSPKKKPVKKPVPVMKVVTPVVAKQPVKRGRKPKAK